jgi:hypothetical protein
MKAISPEYKLMLRKELLFAGDEQQFLEIKYILA